MKKYPKGRIKKPTYTLTWNDFEKILVKNKQ